MEEKKLKQIEAKLSQLLMQVDKTKKIEVVPASKKYHGAKVIRRRKGHMDLLVT